MNVMVCMTRLNRDTMERKIYREDTEATRVGRDRSICGRLVNPPIARTTTVLASNLAEWEETCLEPATGEPTKYYGRFGTVTTQALEQAMVQLEGGYRAMLFPSGLAACTHSLMALVRPGDHVLIVDSAYGPIRNFANGTLIPFGIDVTFYDPGIGAGINSLVRDNTRAIYMESPGSMSFEMQDVPAICEVAKQRGITTLIDNTWATPFYFKPLAHGVDISIHSATKYICGHSDTLLGIATCNRESWDALANSASNFGETASPDAAYVALRGLRTLPTRLRQHHASSLQVAEWLERQPEVACVLHPALASDPGHALWQRDCTGASGLFACVLHPVPRQAFASFIDSLELFGLGVSWGGYESLVAPINLRNLRTSTRWSHEGPAIRLHVGLEDPEDLIQDLAASFKLMVAMCARAA